MNTSEQNSNNSPLIQESQVPHYTINLSSLSQSNQQQSSQQQSSSSYSSSIPSPPINPPPSPSPSHPPPSPPINPPPSPPINPPPSPPSHPPPSPPSPSHPPPSPPQHLLSHSPSHQPSQTPSTDDVYQQTYPSYHSEYFYESENYDNLENQENVGNNEHLEENNGNEEDEENDNDSLEDEELEDDDNNSLEDDDNNSLEDDYNNSLEDDYNNSLEDDTLDDNNEELETQSRRRLEYNNRDYDNRISRYKSESPELYLQKHFKIKMLQNYISKTELLLLQFSRENKLKVDKNKNIKSLQCSYIICEINKIFSYVHLFYKLSPSFHIKIKNIISKYNNYVVSAISEKDYELNAINHRLQYLQNNNIFLQNKNNELKEGQPRCSCCWSSDCEFVIFLPCLHVTCCEECGNLVEKCPICLKDINITKKIYIKTDSTAITMNKNNS